MSGYDVKYEEVAQFNFKPGHDVMRAVVSVYRGGKFLGELHPRIDYYYSPTNPSETTQTMTIPGQRATLEDDLYVLLVDWQPVSTGGATFKIYVNPLVNWLWLCSLLFFLGGVIACLAPPRGGT